jgi:hypothetical protein
VKEKKPDGTTQETISEEEHDTPIVEKVDFFASIVNAALLPLAGHFLNKDVNDLMITDAQSKENVKYMPEDVIIKPSWGAYIGMSLLSVASNVMMAPARNKEAEELDKAKKTLVKMMEVEKLKNEVAKMQAENDRLNNMHVIKPEREQRPWIADAEIISQTGN